MHHPTDFLGCLTAKDGFATIRAYRGRDAFDSNGFPVNVEDFADNLLASLGFSAHMTSEHGYLRRE